MSKNLINELDKYEVINTQKISKSKQKDPKKKHVKTSKRKREDFEYED